MRIAPSPRAALCILAALALCACDRSFGVPPAGANADASASGKQAANTRPAAPSPASDRSRPAMPDRTPSDPEITKRAANAMRGDPALAGADLSVTTTHGVVNVTGTVRSPEQVAVAEARAESPPGVMRVETHLSVNPEP